MALPCRHILVGCSVGEFLSKSGAAWVDWKGQSWVAAPARYPGLRDSGHTNTLGCGRSSVIMPERVQASPSGKACPPLPKH